MPNGLATVQVEIALRVPFLLVELSVWAFPSPSVREAERVARYRRMRDDSPPPPLIAHVHPQGYLELDDGGHRLEAAKHAAGTIRVAVVATAADARELMQHVAAAGGPEHFDWH